MTDREVMQQALHELEGIPVYRKYGVRISNAITALRSALEQQQAEPVAREGFEKWAKSRPNYIDLSRFETGYSDCNTDYAWSGWQAALAQPQQQAEPVTCGYDETTGNCTRNPCCHSTLPQRQWVGLTDEEIGQIILQQEITLKNYVCVDKQTEFARAIEAKLKERNHD